MGTYLDFVLEDERHRMPSVLILGCTPALRRAFSDEKCPVTCIDSSAEMLQASLSVLPAYGTEAFVHADWLDPPEPLVFDVVVGDKVFDNVHTNDWGRLTHSLAGWLAAEGRFVTRLAPVSEELLGVSFADLLSRWSHRYGAGLTTLEAAASGLWEEALGASTVTIPGEQTIARFRKEVDALVAVSAAQGNSTSAVLTHYRELFEQSIDRRWTAYRLGDVVDLLANEFKVRAVRTSADYDAGRRQPVVAFDRRPRPGAGVRPAPAQTAHEQLAKGTTP